MPCSCNQSFCPECMGGNYTPPKPPAVGSSKWKDDQAFTYVIDAFSGLPDKDCIIKLPADWGYFVIFSDSAGKDYRRIDRITEAHEIKT